jgi:membrane protease YdiL (CAAX protease family)
MLKWRVGWQLYALAIGIPLIAALGAVALNVALGAPSLSLAQILGANGDAQGFSDMLGISPVLGLVLVFAIRLINPSDGPLGEEPGWRGYALPDLQAKRSPLVAALMVGLLAALWHLPIFLVGAASPLEILVPFSLGIVSCWIYNRTGGSILLSIILHSADGIFQIGSFGFVGVDAERMVLLYGGLWFAMALGIIILAGSNLGRRPAAQVEAIASPAAAH